MKIKLKSKIAGVIVTDGTLKNTHKFKKNEIKEFPENIAKELLKNPLIVEVK